MFISDAVPRNPSKHHGFRHIDNYFPRSVWRTTSTCGHQKLKYHAFQRNHTPRVGGSKTPESLGHLEQLCDPSWSSWISGLLRWMMAARGSASSTRSLSGPPRQTSALCGSHPLQRCEAADVVGEDLQPDLCPHPHNLDPDCPDISAATRARSVSLDVARVTECF